MHFYSKWFGGNMKKRNTQIETAIIASDSGYIRITNIVDLLARSVRLFRSAKPIWRFLFFFIIKFMIKRERKYIERLSKKYKHRVEINPTSKWQYFDIREWAVTNNVKLVADYFVFKYNLSVATKSKNVMTGFDKIYYIEYVEPSVYYVDTEDNAVLLKLSWG